MRADHGFRPASGLVDSKLRVNGLKNLRIADSSVGVATIATCVLIGKRMAEILTSKT